MAKVGLWALGLLLGLVFLLLIALAVMLNTRWGLNTTLGIATDALPGLSIGQSDGKLTGPLTLQDLVFENDGMRITVDRARIDWRAAGVLGKKVLVDEATASGVQVELLAGPQTEEPSPPLTDLPALTLPVAVLVREMAVTDIEIIWPSPPPVSPAQTGSGSVPEPLVIDRVSLVAQMQGGSITVRNLDVQAPLFSVSGATTVNTLANWNTELEAEFGLRLPDITAGGNLRAEGDLTQMDLALSLQQPAPVRVRAQLRELLGNLHWRGRVKVPKVVLDQIVPTLPAQTLALNIAGSGALNKAYLQGELVFEGQRYVIDEAAAGYDEAQLVIENLALRTPATGGAAQVAGRIELAGEQPVVDLDAAWAAITLPAEIIPMAALPANNGDSPVAPVPVTTSGSVSVEGWLEEFRAVGDIRLQGPIPPTRLTVRGNGSTSQFTADSFSTNVLGGPLQGSGTVQFDPVVGWDLQLQGQNLDPSRLLPEWPGRLQLDLATSGRLTDDGPRGVVVALKRLQGTLRDRPLQASADIKLQTLTDGSGQLRLVSDDSTVTAQGQVNRTSTNIALNLDVNDLADLLPQAEGAVMGNINAQGPVDDLTIRGQLSGEAIWWQDIQVEQFTVSGRADLRQQSRLANADMTIQIESLEAGGVEVQSAQVAVLGEVTRHQLSGQVQLPNSSLEFSLNGEAADNGWTGTLESFNFDPQRFDPWALDAPVDLAFNDQKVSISRACLGSDEARLCAQGQWQQADRQGQFSAVLAAFPLALIEQPVERRFGIPVDVTGQLSGQATVQINGDEILASGSLSSPQGVLSVAGDQPRDLLRFEDLRIGLRLDPQALVADINTRLKNDGSIQGELTLAQPLADDPAAKTLSGAVQADFQNVAWLELLEPVLTAPTGTITASLDLGGTMASPEPTGRIQIIDFGAEFPSLGIAPKNGQFELITDGETVEFTGGIASGEGRIEVEGQAQLDADAGFPATVNVSGQNFLASRTPELRLLASPSIKVVNQDYQVEVTGEVTIPEATIDVSGFESGAVKPSSDVVVVDAEEEEGAGQYTIVSTVTVILGDNVELLGFGFEGGLEGRLTVRDRPGRPTTGSGEIAVSGQYQSYGQDLTIQRGRLIFANSPVDNPALDLRATRDVNEITVGVQVSGTATEPRAEIFSNPAMSQSEALSYLVLGRPLNQASGGDGQSLANAALLGGSNLLAKDLGAAFNLDDVGIVSDSGTAEGSSLRLGKYLSPRLYIAYGIGLLDARNTFLVRYDLTESFAVEAEQGDETRAGIKYQHER